MTDRPPPETVHVPDGPLEAKLPAPASRARKLGRFQVVEELGAGAMGTVFRAHDDVLGRDVAIKTLTADGQLGVRERFLREARAIGAVQHPNILGIYDAGTEGDTPYLVMELATDGTLRDRMKQGPISIESAREVGIQIAGALAAAHAAGIIHRDVKPANILATKGPSGQGIWKLADFGIAHVPDSTLTMTGQFIGSPSYAAPESLRAGQFGAASDVYGLAATLYEALSGAPPHGDHDMRSVIRKLDHEAPALHDKRPDVPGPVGAAIMAGIARDPAQRPSAADFARMLASTTDDRVPVAPRPVPRAPMSPRTKLIAGALATLAVALVAVALSRRSHDAATVMPSALHRSDPTAGDTTATDDPPVYDPSQGQQPVFVDENGNPVDDETAKQLLQQMQQDAEEQMKHPGKGHKKHRRDD